MGKRTTTITVDENLHELVKLKNINLSEFVEGCLRRELEPNTHIEMLKAQINDYQKKISELEISISQSQIHDKVNGAKTDILEKDFINIRLDTAVDHDSAVRYWCRQMGCSSLEELREKQRELREKLE